MNTNKRALICEWEINEDGYWDTRCGNSFELNEGGPKENNFSHCCFCGKNLVESARSIEEKS